MPTSWTGRTLPTTTWTAREEVSQKNFLLINGIDKLLIGTDKLLISQIFGTPYTTRTPI